MKLNYGKLDDIISSITVYITSLKNIEKKIKEMDSELRRNNSFTTGSLVSMTKKFDKEIGGCKDELSDLYESFSGFLEGMEVYLTPKSREGDLVVDNNLGPCLAKIQMQYDNYIDSYKQLNQSIEEYCIANTDDLEREEKTNKEENYRKLHDFFQSSVLSYNRTIKNEFDHLKKVKQYYIDPMVALDGKYYTKVNKLRETYDPSGAATLRRLNAIKNQVKQGGIAFCDLIEDDLTFVGDAACFTGSMLVVAGKKIIQQEPPEWAKNRVDDGFVAVKNYAKGTIDGTWNLLTNPKSVYDGIVKIVDEKGITYVIVYGGTQGCIGASTLGAIKELAGPKLGMLATAANNKACQKVPVLLKVEGKVVKVIGTVQVTKNGIKIAAKSKVAKVMQPFKILEEDIVSFTKNRKGIKIGTAVGEVVEEGTEAVIKSLDDLKKIGIHSADDLAKHGITSFKQLKKLGIKSADDLAELGIKSAENLKKLGITKADQLKKLGITSKDDLKKLGVKNKNGELKNIAGESRTTTGIENLLNNRKELTGSTREKLLATVQNSELSKIVNELYRPGATIGDGGTASILVHEFNKGSSKHLIKAKERLKQLKNLSTSGKLGLNDLDVVDELINDLESAIKLFD